MPKSTDDRSTLLFPIETISRELDFRLLLACSSIRDDNRIFIGQHDIIYQLLQHLEGATYVGGRIFPLLFPECDLTRYQTLKKNRCGLVHLDEEGGIYLGQEPEWEFWLRRRLDPTCLQTDDYICTWGDFQRDFYRSQEPACRENIHTTGHPRFELYKPRFRDYFAPEVQEIKERLGDFILVNTNLTWANNNFGMAGVFSKLFAYDVENHETRRRYFNTWAHCTHIFVNFVRLVGRLSVEMPGTNIVIRPHPSEDIDNYRAFFKGVSNVHILREGSVAPWLFACKMLLHDGCTTGIEAFLGDVSIINYKSVVDEQYDFFLPNLFGVQCVSEDEVIDQVQKILSAGASLPQSALDERAHSLFANFREDSLLRFLEVLRQAEAQISTVPRRYRASDFRRKQAVQSVVSAGKSAVRPLAPGKMARHKYDKGKFAGFDADYISHKLSWLEKELSKKLRWKFHSPKLISVEAG